MNLDDKLGYKVESNLAVRRILDYNHLKILITYNYKTFTSGRTNNNKKKLLELIYHLIIWGIKDLYLDYH